MSVEKEHRMPNESSIRHETTMPSSSSVASSLAGMFLEENLNKGRQIEIPSLGIRLTQRNHKNDTQQEQIIFQEREQPESQSAISIVQPYIPESTSSPVASDLAGMLLEENVQNGNVIEIPSLGIVLTK